MNGWIGSALVSCACRTSRSASGLVSAQPLNPRGSHSWTPESSPDHRDWRVCRFDGFGDWGPAADGPQSRLVR